MGAMTTPMELLISNPGGFRFEFEVDVLSAGPNRVPIFPPIVDQTVMPGDSLTVPLEATDADGDFLTFSVLSATELPASRLDADEITFAPTGCSN